MSNVWRTVKGADLQIGMRLRFGNVVCTLVSIDADGIAQTRRASLATDPRDRFRVDPRQPYRVLYTAPVSRGGVPVVEL